MKSLDGIIKITKPNIIKKDLITAEDIFIFVGFTLILFVAGVQLIINGLPYNNYCYSIENAIYNDIKNQEHIVVPKCFNDTKEYIYENFN